MGKKDKKRRRAEEAAAASAADAPAADAPAADARATDAPATDAPAAEAPAAAAPAGQAPAGEPAQNQALSRKAYDKALKKLHIELVKLQEWVVAKGLKVCIVFEGRDGAGKGGTIKAITERVSPRVFRVIALPAPSDREKTQMYVQRYLPLLPAAGEVVIFDRSWYNRAGVERVMGFCSDEQADQFLKGVPLVERAMVDSGIILLKYWLEVSPEEQTRRLKSRFEDGRKIWKLSPMDLKSYSRWYDYSRARDLMFAATDSAHAPWWVAPSDLKRNVRLNIISHLLGRIPYEELPRDKPELPKRQKRGGYVESAHPFRVIPQTW
ncbi:MAG TPA: polyphosphate kinase 2 [Rubrivivax sp.]|nr:polyphosphate kinase 2 [Pseudomonadota bacterium]HOW46945.1 polyphosphate kinase 2 [Rubrivivax sp.]HRY86932.1 polyphosphate kinase 2 [Rubrivivax sp.]HRZ60084.1 polyphosphate kinase 2 [Rubrivivax sp.]